MTDRVHGKNSDELLFKIYIRCCLLIPGLNQMQLRCTDRYGLVLALDDPRPALPTIVSIVLK